VISGVDESEIDDDFIQKTAAESHPECLDQGSGGNYRQVQSREPRFYGEDNLDVCS